MFAGLIFLGCVVHIASRAQESGTGTEILSQATSPSFAPKRPPPGLWRVITPTFLRQAARVVGWSETATIGILGFLVLTSLGALILTITTGKLPA